MIVTDVDLARPASCPGCGSEEVTLCYSAPVDVLVRGDAVQRVVVDDEATRFTGVIRCRACDRAWRSDEEPETGVWPPWEEGW